MKKTLVILLALVFVLSIGATALAAPANPFVDVPAKHWAYDAVSKLAKAGIVDGYGDGTFRGDKTMTRYEMAQIVAKAMARSDKASAENKALVDKLAVEFAAELNNLGVRVAKLEANQQNIKFTGNFWMRYTTDDYATAASTGGAAQYRLRLDGVAQVDDKTTFGMRFVTREPDKAVLANDTWQTFGQNAQSGNNYNNIDRVFVSTKIGEVATTVGRQALMIDSQSVIMDSGAFSFDGAKFGFKAGDFNLTTTWGRFLKGAVLGGTGSLGRYSDVDIASLVAASKVGKFDYSLGYYNMNNPVLDKAAARLSLIDTKYTFDSKLTLQTEYVKNGAAKLVTGKGDTAWAAKLTFGDFAINKAGANNFYFQYTDKKANAFLNNFSALAATPGKDVANNIDFKEYVFGYNYGFSKTFNATLEYGYVKGENDLSTNTVKQLRFVTNVIF